MGKRLSGFWILSVLASGFSAILAYALTLLAGTHGLNGWRCKCSGASVKLYAHEV